MELILSFVFFYICLQQNDMRYGQQQAQTPTNAIQMGYPGMNLHQNQQVSVITDYIYA